MRRRITALILALCTVPALAHDLWIERESGAYVLYNGHKHSGHAGTEVIPYDADFVKQARCYDVEGRVGTESAGGSPFRLVADCAVLTLSASSGYWSKTPYGTKPLPKDEVTQVVKSWLSLESVKRIDVWAPVFAAPLTQDLEIVPLEDPLTLAAGDKLHLRVTLAGQPVSGAVVTYDGDPRGASDAEGHVNVRIRRGGFQLIEAGISRPLDSPQADEEIRTAVLVFELPE